MKTQQLNQAAITEQELNEEDLELLKEVYSRLEVFEEECREYHTAAKEAREIMRLRDPHQDPPNAKVKTLQLQTLKSTINNSIADQMQNMPEARLLPETPDKEILAEDLQDVVRYIIYDLNNYENIHRRRTEDLFVPGTAITQITWDESMANGKGDIALVRWPVEAFLWDPRAEDIQDARALIKVSWHPKSWFEQHYPDKAMYISGEDGQYNNVGKPDVQSGNRNDEDTAMLLEYWYRRYDAKKKRYTINVAICAGGALLDKQENVFEHGMYPFVFDVHSTIEGAPVGDGLVTELAPMMRYINKYARYIDTNLRYSAKGRMITRKNCGINKKDLADWDVDIVEGDSVVQGEDWGWIQGAPFNSMIANEMMQLQSEMKQDSGANQYTRGETTGGVVSAKAITALQEAGGKIAGLRTDTLNNGFRKIVEQVLWLISEFYDDDRLLLITGKDKSQRAVEFTNEKFFGKKKKGGIQPPPYMVQIEINKRNPGVIAAQNEMFMQAYTMAAQAQQFFPLSSLFQILNIDGKDRLMPVIRANEKTQEQMQQMAQQNEQLTAQVEQLAQENENLKGAVSNLSNATSEIGATLGQGYAPSAAGTKQFSAGQSPNSMEAMVQQARQQLGGQQGAVMQMSPSDIPAY